MTSFSLKNWSVLSYFFGFNTHALPQNKQKILNQRLTYPYEPMLYGQNNDPDSNHTFNYWSELLCRNDGKAA